MNYQNISLQGYSNVQNQQIKLKIQGSTKVEENIRHDDNESNKEVNRLRIPNLAYINDLFPCSIPVEIQSLTIVEDSMINIYSAIRRRQILQNEKWNMLHNYQ
jgi:hypothetical protein